MQGLKLSSCAGLFKMLPSFSEMLQKTDSFNQHAVFFFFFWIHSLWSTLGKHKRRPVFNIIHRQTGKAEGLGRRVNLCVSFCISVRLKHLSSFEPSSAQHPSASEALVNISSKKHSNLLLQVGNWGKEARWFNKGHAGSWCKSWNWSLD